ncbi:piezo-type mechanosensitive ion channel component isoform X3 [Anoplophora glabripennis]|uniref:piezo-type mechanosensitive ion channel component isoform X3 n=1 Tax=Anoplophora glabripennis TaxID=217634 RepID=UPI000874BAA6|nr:piezo-type mechanosensitive ion channel component isoform X3 [Anoplophora glabripennis]
MASFLCILLFRVLLPILISTSVIFRPSGLSALYLLILFYLPFVPVPTEKTMSGHTGIFLKILIVITSLTALGQVIFQIVLVAKPPYAEFLENDVLLEKILRHVGFIRLNNVDPISATVWLSPEVVMLAISIGFFIAMRKLSAPISVEASNEEGEDSANSRSTKTQQKYFSYLVAIGRYCVLFALCSAAVLRPSVLGGLYFIVFLATITWWSCCKQLRRGFAIVLGCLTPVVFIHLSALYSYQFQWPQEFLERNSSYARYFGLTQLITVSLDSSDDPRNFLFTDEEWASFVNPLALYLLYYMLVLEVKGLLQPLLIQGVSPSKRYGSGKKSGIFQDSTGSVTVTGENTEDIPLDELGTIEDEYKPTVLENIVFALESVLQIIIRSSYIGTNIIMMAWSITYLSWITFVLLIWANLIWLIPNQRKSMLYSSPFLVFYALFLLISAYIYSMNLTDEELPIKVSGVNLEEIGFVKMRILPCLPLYIKCLYTIMFWITLRQYMQERKEQRQSSALADMVAPLQVTVGTAAGVNKEQEKGNKTIEKIGKYIKKFLTKFWIWIVAITLFAVAITGDRMTGFRIVYMALFLFFILSFQFSFRMWRKMMFVFWLVVIIYSMIILVMVYTYQFENFKKYWENLGVPIGQQEDIGLEKYETKRLFVRLVTPTFFVIITVIQLHYFHKDFMHLSDPKNTSILREDDINNDEDLDQSSLQGGAVIERSEKDETTTSSVKFDLYELGNMSNAEFQHLAEEWLKKLHRLKNLVYLFLELHMVKVVLLFAMLICVYDLCALYLVIIILLSLAVTFGRPVQIFAIYTSSLLVSMLLLARMIFQIKYITPENWNVTCVSGNDTYKVNNAYWFGFDKTNAVPRLVKWNIAYTLVVTLWSVILIRQHYYRISRGRPTTRAFFMFPKVTRADADKDLKTCLKYFANYGFYKFGLEISLMATVAVIGIRMDMYAVFYSIWLCILFSMKRSVLSRVWVFYLIFIAVLLPIQYFMAVGLPPTLCQEFPWDKTNYLRALQDWAFLLDKYNPPPVKKLICDFILLLIVSRQWVVFRIERRYAGKNYAGGSNESIIHHAEEKGFVNPVPDFITYVRSYLDIFKKGILLSFLWITLAIVFLAGTNRVNIFSIGYLIGAFVFLWHGSDFYLRPIRSILRQWQWLLGYNVTVIFLKTSFQILGCIYIQNIPTDYCWLVQVLGIGCVRKFGNLNLPNVDIGDDIDPKICKVPREFIGIAWDGICFGLLIIQRRIFNSYNFFHMVDETKATTILASRGAELIEEMRLKTMKDQEEIEHRILEKIKQKMDRIKANQQKMQGVSYKDRPQLGRDSFFRPKHRRKPPVTYKEAIRSGDYYMFDDFEDDEIDLLPQESLDRESRLGEKPNISEIEEHEPRSVRIRELPKDDDPQPGTSKDEDISELTEPKVTIRRKIINALLFVWAFIESAMISLTNFLNSYSRSYRYVLKVLAEEKKNLKEKTNYSIGLRLGSTQVWQPAGSYHTLLQQSHEGSPVFSISTAGIFNPSDSYRIALVAERMASVQNSESEEKPPNSEESDTKALAMALPYSSDLERRKASVLTVPEIRILAPSLERGLDSPCSSRESALSPHPHEYIEELSSKDQPTIVKLLLAIWYIIMSRSEILCYFVIFLNQIKTATFMSLPLPLMVFFWGSLTIPRPSKTFWITIIAYTEVIVLIKCLFQFDVMSENSNWFDVGYRSNPFYPPKVIGTYRQKNYALWDLLLLLVVFFHRVLLKSMGIWSSSPVPAALVNKGNYKLEDGQLVPLNSGSPKNNSKQEDTSQSTSKKSELTLRDDDNIFSIETSAEDPLSHLPQTLQLATSKYAESFKKFIHQLLDPTSRVAADVYSFMFLCDFFNFFVILIGFSAFGAQQDGGVSSYLQDNRVPPLFLFMLILQFMLIVIDRGIYLRKNILGKIIFQFIQIVLLHVWLFIVFPVTTGSQFNKVLPPQMYYMVKCFYLLLSAYQIRCGYPTRILGNFLCKGYGYVNMFLFKGFMLVPFLFELRTCMDWMWTETSMTVFDWIKMEDIFAHIYQLKCTRNMEDEFPQPRGEKKAPLVKYAMGTVILAIIIGIIWFPLVFFSLGNAVGEPNIPYDVTLEIRIGPYEPVYKMSAQSNSIIAFKEGDLIKFMGQYSDYKASQTFLSNYEAADIAAVKLSVDSANIWSISPPDRKRMVAEINSTSELKVRLEYKVSHRTSNPEDSGVIPDNVEIIIPASINGIPSEVRNNLLKMLEGQEVTSETLFEYILPKFLKVTNRGTAAPVDLFMLDKPDTKAKRYRNVTLNLLRTGGQEWWQIHEVCNDTNFNMFLSGIPYQNCSSSIILYTFNDKIFPPTLNFLTGGGIIGLYTTLVLVASRVLRGLFADQCSKIMFEDMPNVDRVLQLCLDIYLVREAREFALEEDLFAKLVFLFRSPETLIKWTRPKEEIGDDDDPEAEGR